MKSPSWNNLPICSGRHADAGVGDRDGDPVAAFLFPLPPVDGDGPVVGEFVGVAQQIQQRLPQAHLIGIERSDRTVTIDRDLVPPTPMLRPQTTPR
jgi:hypothetical protein